MSSIVYKLLYYDSVTSIYKFDILYRSVIGWRTVDSVNDGRVLIINGNYLSSSR